jgi:putative N6-adenine-specific DNA methylase
VYIIAELEIIYLNSLNNKEKFILKNVDYQEIIVKTFSGLEDILAEELKNLGAEDIQILSRAVKFTGSKKLAYLSNLHLRTALRVIIPIAKFDVHNDTDLYNRTKTIKWEDFITPESTIAVDSSINSSVFNHTNYVALKVKDAIVDKMRDIYGKRPSVDVENPDLLINVHIFRDECTISLDSSGFSLHKRGYRQAQTDAPLNEVLAAGMILMTGWKGETDFYDLMCGSGTITTEAFLIAINKAPGLELNFGFMRWKDYDEQLWNDLKADAVKEIKSTDIRFFTSDILGKAVAVTKLNMRQPEMRRKVKISQQDFFKTYPQGQKGLIVLNPPYGERIPLADNKEFYKKIGDKLKFDYPDFTCWILSGNPESIKFIGLRPVKKINLLNGIIECKFQKYELYSGSKKDLKSNSENL